MAKAKQSEQQLIYAGLRRKGESSTVVSFAKPDDLESLLTFTTPRIVKLLRRCAIGGIYTFECDGEGTWTFPHIPKTESIINDKDQIAAWVAAEKVALANVRLVKHLANSKKQSSTAIDDLLIPLRREYRNTDSHGRLILQALVLDALRKPV